MEIVNTPERTVLLDVLQWTDVIDALQDKIVRLAEQGKLNEAGKLADLDALLREQVDQCVGARIDVEAVFRRARKIE